MNYEEIIKFLEKNNIDTYNAFVATTCYYEYIIYSHEVSKPIDYNHFCVGCNEIWLDSDGDIGLEKVAEMVERFLANKGTLPTTFKEVFDYCESAEDLRGED